MDRRILIIEDNEHNRELMIYLLQEYGYVPLVAKDGEAGLAAVRRERPDLVVCDIQLPKLDGFEIAQAMKADSKLRNIPIIAVTALAMTGDREKGLAAGFDGYIYKPIESKSFVAQVESFLGLPPGARPAEALASPTFKSAKKALVLAVDDLPANAKLVESLLEPFGYSVITTSGMTDAMALARQHRPDLIISDVQMHEGSGYELCEALKTDHRLREIPVILITSTFCDELSRKKGLALGAVRYLFRPIDSLKLLGEIEDCLPARK
jgi:two-component system cell cycle response regulator